ncbi:MAG TPA: DUF2207 domain-containing protein [Candidatus Saccharibacteria bacterium]|nr:DUF2207 domain-containing protein [Candidatus Saccharibacteria bacterium]HRK94346.1 DUF2207 domain-containing protein [Candidatus Saccharibacteria bacterium]
MKRLIGAALALVLACSAVPAHALNLQNLTIRDYKIDYSLSRDNDNRSRLTATETITAVFPDFDQNHGIERAIPKSYDGHPVSLDIKSVKKADGTDWNYTTYDSNDNLVVRIGDADKYMHGVHTYEITYTQRDVTRYFADTKSDEFYWDTNGTEWQVPIEKLEVSLAVDEEIATNLNENYSSSCYQGAAGATDSCKITRTANVFTVQAANLQPGENVTLALGFKQGTFAKYEPSLWEKILGAYLATLFVVSAVAIGLMIWLIVRWSRWSRRSKEVGTIVPEYLPPKEASVATAASLITPRGSAFTAQLLDFAVRHYLKVYQTKEKSMFKQAEYDIEIVKDPNSLKPEEQEILKDIFGGELTVGRRLALKTLKSNTTVYSRTLDNDKKLKALVRGSYGLRERNTGQSGWFKKTGWVLLVAAIVLLNPMLLIVAIITFALGYTLWPLTDKGLALYRYLEGLKMYIGVAETERLKMLQSPEGAAKVDGVDPNDPSQLVKLYEKVLPYAVLFGQEKEWTKRIGEIYEASQTQPSWYAGNHAVFNAAVFSSAMNGFSTSAAYSSASSSSSGGSSGGGSSGGGGGGGGGGGW